MTAVSVHLGLGGLRAWRPGGGGCISWWHATSAASGALMSMGSVIAQHWTGAVRQAMSGCSTRARSSVEWELPTEKEIRKMPTTGGGEDKQARNGMFTFRLPRGTPRQSIGGRRGFRGSTARDDNNKPECHKRREFWKIVAATCHSARGSREKAKGRSSAKTRIIHHPTARKVSEKHEFEHP